MLGGMAEVKSGLRLTDSVPGRLAGWALAVLWVYAMAAVDAHSFTAYPACVALAVVVFLVLLGVLMGRRVVRMRWLSWFSLAAGGYFLLRCVNSYALTDSWGDEAIILAAMVYYVAGVYVAQNQRYASLFIVLAVALVINGAAFWAARQPWFCFEWTGRAQFTPEGGNRVPVSLFVYKNFAGFFFVVGGMALGAWANWTLKGWRKSLALALAAGSVAISFCCHTRVPWCILPVGLVILWGGDVLQQVFAGKKISMVSYGIGFLFLAVSVAAVWDLMVGNHVGQLFSDADSHFRYEMWAAVCETLPQAPLWGYGAGATEWETVPYLNSWAILNYAHNDYLQLWADYGLIGVGLAVVMLFMHAAQAIRCVSSSVVNEKRRALVAVAVVVLICMAAYAAADFPCHSFALICMSAFACGVLASPFPYERDVMAASRKNVAPDIVQVKAQRWPGKIVLVVLALCVAGMSVQLGNRLQPVWMKQWEYNALSKSGEDEKGTARRSMIAELLHVYPAPALMDTYYMLPPPHATLEEQEKMLRTVLAANPRQRFTALMLADVLDRLQRYEESERMYRNMYVGDGMGNTSLARWHSYYAHHLLLWGCHELRTGHPERALSLLDYALIMHKKNYIHFRMPYRSGEQPWMQHGGIKSYVPKLVKDVQRDVQFMKKLGIQPDDAWQLPLEPGGKPALYRRLLDKTSR